MVSQMGLILGQFHERFFHHNSNAMEILFYCGSVLGKISLNNFAHAMTANAICKIS